MKKTIVYVRKMDCPSEIKMIEGLFEGDDGVKQMNFNLGERQVTFFHKTDESHILGKLKDVGLEGKQLETREVSENEVVVEDSQIEAKTLKILLGINFTMFLVEIVIGIFAESAGLLADGLDMLADSFVYGMSLYATGKSLSMKNKAATFSGGTQIFLALFILFEAVRRFFVGSEPVSILMMSISLMALVANVSCLALIHKHREGGIHMQASWIFSANDVLANTGVIIAGAFVYFTGSNIPDLVIGIVIAIIVLRGGFSILKLAKAKA